MAFSQKILFVIGAGASLPYGYPLGDNLIDEVLRQSEAKTRDRENGRIFSKLSNLISLFDPLSIDIFLKNHCDEELQDMLKQMIAWTILEKEDSERFKKGRQVIIAEAGKKIVGNANWYRHLAHAMFEDLEDLINPEIPLPFKIITFNYDVSLDYYLLTRVLEAPLLTEDDKQHILEKLGENIIHVYGAVRDVPWENAELTCYETSNDYLISPRGSDTLDHEFETERTPFIYGIHKYKSHFQGVQEGIKISASDHFKKFVDTSAQNLGVVGEDRDTQAIQKKLAPYHEFAAQEAKKIMFLGFGFDRTNMELIFPENVRSLYTIFGSLHATNKCNTKTIQYTNYGNKKKINDYVRQFFPDCNIECSTKDVYGAFVDDFHLS